MRLLALGMTALTLALAGAIAGFFYAYSCSVMWGLDATAPAAAIAAMQAINAVVRNAVFAPAFFGTPVAAALAAALWLGLGNRQAALFLALAVLVYLAGAFATTLLINVPMNVALAAAAVPADPAAAKALWQNYAGPWTAWNHLRTGASLLALLLVGAALHAAGRPDGPR